MGLLLIGNSRESFHSAGVPACAAAAAAAHGRDFCGPLGNLRVLPNPARAGEPVVARLFSSGCASFDPETFVVTVQDNVVTLTHVVDEICGVPPPGFDVDFALGSFLPGDYTLIYAPTSPIIGFTYVPQSAGFVVASPARIATVPIASPPIIVLLGFGTLLIGILRMARRAQHAC